MSTDKDGVKCRYDARSDVILDEYKNILTKCLYMNMKRKIFFYKYSNISLIDFNKYHTDKLFAIEHDQNYYSIEKKF
ncbi:MAG: hypothetical protein ACR5KW_02190 [Wolbachia sp.]